MDKERATAHTRTPKYAEEAIWSPPGRALT